MKKRIVSLLMAGIMVFSLAACGGKDTSLENQAGGNADDGKTEDGEEGGTTFAEAGSGEREKFTVTFIQNEWHGDPNEMEIFNKLEEIANVYVEWQVYPSATWPDKKNLILSSGDLPDVFYMNAVNSVDVSKYASQGMFIELTDLIEQYAPNITAAFERLPSFKNICVNPDDGKIYTIGRAVEREAQDTAGVFYINKKWLDQLGMKVPETVEEYYEVLTAFKENDMNGNGDTEDELPFVFHLNTNKPDAAYYYQSLFGSFGYVDFVGTMGSHFIEDENGEIVYVAETEEYKNAIQYFHKFVEEGLWDSEGFTTQDTSVMNAKGHNDPEIVGSFIAFDSTFVLPEEYQEDYVVLPPLAGPDGTRVWLKSGDYNRNVNGTQFVMTVNAKGKEEAIMRWLNAHFEPEISAQLFLGAIGTTLEKTESGMLDYVDTPEGMSYSEFRYGNAPVHVPCMITADDWGTLVQVMDEDVNKLKIAKEVYAPYQTQSSLFLLPNKEESKYFTSDAKDIDDYVNKMQVKWLTEGGIEEEWDTYLQQLETLGIEKYKETVIQIRERMAQE